MKHLIIISTFLISLTLQAQQWSEPVLISTMQGNNYEPDFCIDTAGVLHCVWSHKIGTNYRKIYYSKSEDQGETWSEPEDVLQNDYLWMSNPHIACDSQNKLYLTYDYNVGTSPSVLLRTFDGSNWSEADTISTDMPYSYFNKIVIDNNDRVYVFWNWISKIYYRHYENGEYSEIFCPYPDINEKYMENAVIDNLNNIHCIGSFKYDGQTAYEERHIYYKYDYANNTWSDFTFLSREGWYYWSGNDIALDQQQRPHCVWHEKITSTLPYNDATFYSYFNGSEWLQKDTVVEDPWYQAIGIDINNKIHIFDEEKSETGDNLVHYMKMANGWEGEIIDYADACAAQAKVTRHDNQLFVIYTKCEFDDNVNITFLKLETPVSVPENHINNLNAVVLEQNYPNPCSVCTTINFELNKAGQTSLKIFDLKGNLIAIPVNEYKQQGKYSIVWDITNSNGQRSLPGIYLYRLQVNNRVKTRSFIIN